MTDIRSSRRRFLRKGAGAATAAACLHFGAPFIHAKNRPVLRVLGTHVTLHEELRIRAEKELGIDIVFQPGGSSAVLHQASTRPESFDLYEQWSNSLHVLWQANAIAPIEIDRLQQWDQINDLTKTGKIADGARFGAGDAPYKLLYVQNKNTLGPKPTSQISFLPYVHNVDSFGYNSAVIPRGKPYETESWAWLLDSQHKGRVALVNAPTIGLFDAALAVQAKGLAEFNDVGNLSRADVDKLFSILIELRKDGHFRGFWSSVPESVDFMKRGEVVIESMFSPAVSSLKGEDVSCVYAAPKEGYRAWHGVMCLSSKATGSTKEAAYKFMNWWLSGWPGAYIARQGYYISNPENSRKHLSPAEWDYWYEGKPAKENLKGTSGEVVVQKGERRNGGSYTKRFSNIAVWNTVMNTYEYSLTKWSELLLS